MIAEIGSLIITAFNIHDKEFALIVMIIVGILVLKIWFWLRPSEEMSYLYDTEIIGNELDKKIKENTVNKSNEEKLDYIKKEKEKYAVLKESNNTAPIGIIISFLGIISAVVISILKDNNTPITIRMPFFEIIKAPANTGLSDTESWFIVIAIVFFAIGHSMLKAIKENANYSIKVNWLTKEEEQIKKFIDDVKERENSNLDKACKIKQYKMIRAKLKDINKQKKEENERLIQELKEIQNILKSNSEDKATIKKACNKIINNIF